MPRPHVLAAAAVALALCFIGSLEFKVHEGGVKAVISEISFLGFVGLIVFFLVVAFRALMGRRRARSS